MLGGLFVCYIRCHFFRSSSRIFMKFCTDVQHLWSKLNFTAHYREVGVKGQGQNHGVENLSITVAWPRFEISLPNLAV